VPQRDEKIWMKRIAKNTEKGRENQKEELEKKQEETERKFVVRPGKGKKERAVRENLLRKQEKKTK